LNQFGEQSMGRPIPVSRGYHEARAREAAMRPAEQWLAAHGYGPAIWQFETHTADGRTIDLRVLLAQYSADLGAKRR
jgi:hypothetical protein